MKRFRDPLLLVLLGLLLASLTVFVLGIIPYPVGLLVLTVFIVARIVYLQGPGK